MTMERTQADLARRNEFEVARLLKRDNEAKIAADNDFQGYESHHQEPIWCLNTSIKPGFGIVMLKNDLWLLYHASQIVFRIQIRYDVRLECGYAQSPRARKIKFDHEVIIYDIVIPLQAHTRPMKTAAGHANMLLLSVYSMRPQPNPNLGLGSIPSRHASTR